MPKNEKSASVFFSKIWLKLISFTLIFSSIVLIINLALFQQTSSNNLIANADTFSLREINNSNFPLVNPNDLCTTKNIKCTESNRKLYNSKSNIGAISNKTYSSVTLENKISGLHLFPNILRSDSQNGINIGFGERYEGQNWVSHTLNEFNLNLQGETIANKVFLEETHDLGAKFSLKNDSNEIEYFLNSFQGSPFVFVKPNKNQLNIKLNNFNIFDLNNRIILQQRNSNTFYAIFSDGIFTRQNNNLNFNFTLSPKKYLNLAYFNNLDLYNQIEKYGHNTLEKAEAKFLQNNNEFVTDFKFTYSNNSPNKETVFGLLPHQYDHLNYNQNPIYRTNTLRGEQRFFSINENLQLNIEKEAIIEELPLNSLLSESEKSILRRTVQEETRTLSIWSGGSYYGGKNLNKAARLLEIANELNMTQEKNAIQDLLKRTLVEWFTLSSPDEWWKIFKYDRNMKSIFATPEEFGNEKEMNDHHFHYGLVIYASSVLAKYDSSFRTQFAPMINLLIRDIASPNKNDPNFPYLRVYDIYEGHSWASGTGNFTNGNNQESTSEAIFAWYSIWKWGQVINDSSLTDYAHYLYTNEINSTNYYWLNRVKKTPVISRSINYKNSTASLVWGGAYVFDTWFSKDILAIKGIQYLPFSAGSLYLYDKTQMEKEWIETTNRSDLLTRNSGWADLNLMYYSMIKGKSVRANIEENVNLLSIDNGNTKSNYLSWILAMDKIKNITNKKSNNQISYYEFTSYFELYHADFNIKL
jgi:endoglucanase Acf2